MSRLEIKNISAKVPEKDILKGLDLDRDTINTIMAEHGKLITEAKEKIREYEDEIAELKGAGDKSKEIQKELDDLKKSVADAGLY